MGHYIEDADRMFRGVVYRQKTTAELRQAFQDKIQRTNELLAERTQRVKQICDDFSITDQQLTNLVLQYQDNESSFVSFQSQDDESTVVPAGAIANIVQEKKMSESERSQLRKLERVLRNIQDTEMYQNPRTGEFGTRESIHELTDVELEYLGF